MIFTFDSFSATLVLYITYQRCAIISAPVALIKAIS